MAKLSGFFFPLPVNGHIIKMEPYVVIKRLSSDYYDTFTLFSDEAILLYIFSQDIVRYGERSGLSGQID